MSDLDDRLRRDVRGTAMTEFVIVLPVFLVIFVGIVELGKYGVVTVQSRGSAKVETLDAYFDNQTAESGLLREVSNSDGFDRAAHFNPKTASGSALDQLETHPPHGEGRRAGNHLVRSYERKAYLGLLDGHFGEATARVDFLARTDQFNAVGVSEIVPEPRKHLFGENTSHLVLAGDLMEDGASTTPSRGECKSLVDQFGGRLNDALSATGARPMIAAGIRYGTVTGRSTPESGRSVTFAGKSFRPDIYWNTLVGPQFFTDHPNRQTALATLVSRLALQACHRAPYVELPGIGRGGTGGTSGQMAGLDRGGEVNRRLPTMTEEWSLSVPDPYESGPYEAAGFRAPFRYRGSFLSIDYGD